MPASFFSPINNFYATLPFNGSSLFTGLQYLNVNRLKGHPIWGFLHETSEKPLWILEKAHKKCKEEYTPGLSAFYIAIQPILYVGSPHIVSEILKTKTQYIDKGNPYFGFNSALGEEPNIIGTNARKKAEHEQWLNKRTFHRNHLKPEVLSIDAPVIQEICTQYLEEAHNQTIDDIFDWMTRFSVDVICRTKFSFEASDALRIEESREISDAISNFFKIVSDPINVTWKSLPEWLQTYFSKAHEAVKKYDTAKERLHTAFIESILKPHGEKIMESKNFLSSIPGTVDGKLWENKQVVTDGMTFLLAGHETTARLMTFTMILLASHTEKQTILANEINQYCEDNNKSPEELTDKDIKKLPYLNLVIKESLRIYPPIPAFFKEVTTDVNLGNEIPLLKGQHLIISPLMIQRDEANFINALSFHPERFAKDDPKSLDFQYYNSQFSADNINEAYIPFSVGERNCVGMHFAQVEAALWLARLVASNVLTCTNEIPHPVEVVIEGTLKPKNPVSISFSLRTNEHEHITTYGMS